MRARIAGALDDVGRAEGVRVLLAVESSSRAWGFPSRDSDRDVRFLYVRSLAAYLGVVPPRDTIERLIVDGLDLGGWDVRKALGLLVRSNATVLEWLASPITYRRDEQTAAGLAGVARLIGRRLSIITIDWRGALGRRWAASPRGSRHCSTPCGPLWR